MGKERNENCLKENNNKEEELSEFSFVVVFRCLINEQYSTLSSLSEHMLVSLFLFRITMYVYRLID